MMTLLRSKLSISLTVLLIAGQMSLATAATDWIDLQSFVSVGDAQWKLVGDTLSADAGKGFLVTKTAYEDFDLKLEFYAESGTNSGVFFRCDDPTNISDKTCYEANIFDSRPDPTYRSGAITGLAPPKSRVDTEGKWNAYRIFAQGDLLVVTLNGVETVRVRDTQHTRGPIALQLAAGGVKFRNVQITDLGKSHSTLSENIVGLWELTAFELDDGNGNVTPWCEGAYGVILYTEGYMSVAINCDSNPSKMVQYSGPYHLEGDTVVHDVRNFCERSLKQVFRRSVTMLDRNHLVLTGPLAGGGKAMISWRRK